MMIDLEQRLRLGGPNALEVTDQAADVIAELGAQVKRLQGTLRYIETQARQNPSGGPVLLAVIAGNARVALDERSDAIQRLVERAEGYQFSQPEGEWVSDKEYWEAPVCDRCGGTGEIVRDANHDPRVSVGGDEVSTACADCERLATANRQLDIADDLLGWKFTGKGRVERIKELLAAERAIAESDHAEHCAFVYGPLTAENARAEQEAIIQAGADLLTEKQYEIDAFRAALTGLIHYAEQLELLVYAPEDRAEHPAMAAARAVIAKSENRRRFAAVDAAIALKGSGQ
jgi:uncharacterized coiled-coil protein SlyX